MSATLKMFMPVPPNTSLAKMTANAVATATIHSGVSTGTMSGMRKPVTRKPSCISCPLICAEMNSMPSPTMYDTSSSGNTAKKP